MDTPHVDINDERAVRVQKLHDLTEAGYASFPAVSEKKQTIAECLVLPLGSVAQTAGRIMLKRDIGKLTFCMIQDDSGMIQAVFTQDALGKDQYKVFVKKIDVGDILDIAGERIQTQTGEESIQVTSWTLLTKALLPLPDKFHGLQNEELRMRKRYLDILTNPELQDVFKKKAQFWDVTRTFLKDKGFFEVETPYLETTTGGAEATPFTTHHNDYDIDAYLRISVGELWQKRLMAAGFEKTFEIGRIFRNEGSSPDHLQEFTNMEFYWAYADYRKGMTLVQELYRKLATDVFGTSVFEHKGMTFDLSQEWREIDYVTEIHKQTGVDVLTATEDEMKAELTKLGVVYEGDNKERLTDTLWKYCRKTIAGPAFLVNHPKLVSPLAKTHRDNPLLTERFQIILAGSEVGNGYSELNDPLEQRARFEKQQELLASGDTEAMMPDWEFVEMLEHGMPPTCGFGFGERLFAFFVGKPLREVTLFPFVKPLEAQHAGTAINRESSSQASFQPLPITREEAWVLVQTYNTEQNEFNHYLESEAIMRGLARRLGRDEDYWGMLGLLHDLDWHMTKEHDIDHITKSPEMLRTAGFAEDFIDIIISHGFGTGCGGGVLKDKKRSREIEFALAASETLTGLIHSSALMKEGKVSDLEVSSLKKKFKNKKFAAKVNRDVILECERIGIPLEEFLQIGIDAVRSIAQEVELS